MWIGGFWVPATREILYGIGFVIFIVAIGSLIISMRRKKKDSAPANRVFRGKNLERAGTLFKKKEKENYDDLPIVDLKWQKGKGNKNKKSSDVVEDENEDDEDDIDDGYTVVEKTIAEKSKQLQFTPKKQSLPRKEESQKPSKKDATSDKIDFFTTNKNAL